MTPSGIARTIALLLLLTPVASAAEAQITASPSTINVNAQAPTTAFIAFRGLGATAGTPTGGPSTAAVPAEAYWCGRTVSATPARGSKCDAATLFGQLPAGLDGSQVVGGTFTDLMSMPSSVARRAYQAAQAGSGSTFYYVRRFVRAGRPDEFVAVACRLVGNVGVSFGLTDVTVRFSIDTPVLFVAAGDAPPTLSADIKYSGSGQLAGRWELVRPGDDLPTTRDLLTEGSLPIAERGTQHRYAELSRFSAFLPPSGRYTLAGPDVRRLPTGVDGTYFVLLRIESTSEAGPAAGFAMPVLRYIVGARGAVIAPQPIDAPVVPLFPGAGASLTRGQAMAFSWMDVANAAFYRLEIEHEDDGTAVLNAIVSAGLPSYRTPPWLAERAGPKALRWRVVAVDDTGRTIGVSVWRHLEPQR